MDENTTFLHHIIIKERKTIVIEGVKKLDSFDKNDFLIDTTYGYLHISGCDLSLGGMDMEKGHLSIDGKINSLAYLNKESKKKESFIKKLFK